MHSPLPQKKQAENRNRIPDTNIFDQKNGVTYRRGILSMAQLRIYRHFSEKDFLFVVV